MKRKLYRFAKNNCANFYGNLNRRKDYCPLEGSCILKDDKPCSWFQKAVLPLDPALQEQYYRQVATMSDSKKRRKPIAKRRCKICRKPITGRRIYCDRCRNKMRRKTYRKAKQKVRTRTNPIA